MGEGEFWGIENVAVVIDLVRTLMWLKKVS